MSGFAAMIFSVAIIVGIVKGVPAFTGFLAEQDAKSGFTHEGAIDMKTGKRRRSDSTVEYEEDDED